MAALQGRVHDSHAVDISSLARQLMQELAAAESSSQPQSRGSPTPIIIAEVGNLTRHVDAAEYDPHHVSIGPYHRTTNGDLARDDEKIRSLAAVLTAASAAAGTTLEVYLDQMARLEVKARSCYAHKFAIDSEDFVRMLLLDACYLLVTLGVVTADGRRTNGAAASNGHIQGEYQHGAAPLTPPAACGSGQMERVAVVRDVLYLAENQIPFFVVGKIYELTFSVGGVSAADRFAESIRNHLLSKHKYSEAKPHLSEPGNLLHLVHMHFKPSSELLSPTGGKVNGEEVYRWRTATEYHFAGIKFKAQEDCSNGARCILDVKFKSSTGVLVIPHLKIDAETWRLLRNMMALEQHNPGAAGSHVTAYCVFMSQLACTPSDVGLLSRSGVIAHVLGNNAEVAGCFTDLCKGVVFSVNDEKCNYLRATCQALDQQFRSRHSRWMAWLRQKYFRNPWLAVGLAAAVVGLVCTIVQAVYAVLSYR